MQEVLIIGATGDVAKAVAQKYAEKGTNLILAARNKSLSDAISSDLNIRYNVSCKSFALDILNYGSHQPFLDELGTLPQTTIVFTGYLGDHDKALNEWGETEKILHTNFTGNVSLINKIANIYEKQQAGTIAVFSSVAGERGRQSNYIYGSAKAAMTAYLSGLRNRLHKSKVHVLTVKPGFMDTKMTEGLDLPKILTAQPEKAAKATIKAIEKGKDTVYILWMWKYIMLIIKLIPEGIFKKMKL